MQRDEVPVITALDDEKGGDVVAAEKPGTEGETVGAAEDSTPEGTERKLSNDKFVQRADPEIVEAERARLGELGTELELLERNLAGLAT